ncbi:hypothetical protein EC919_104365 [Pseudomonas graminis]|uniref:hypothetical protein n=1 Tax=Pseudomonas graminis TaxID=158627 RepID=UPI00105CC757|nr:hypothetical protein [Pseudomonas graminis]TDV54626.1 hypothetical protein EC919_104365 [Pseudomonas graminis]
MSQQPSQTSNPSWFTVAGCSLALSLATGLITAAVKVGKQDSDNETLRGQNEELRTQQDQLSAIIKDWRKAYDEQGAQFQTTKVQLQALENDRCTPLLEQVNQMKNYVNQPYGYGYNAEKVPDLQRVLDGYQQTLRACYNARM